MKKTVVYWIMAIAVGVGGYYWYKVTQQKKQAPGGAESAAMAMMMTPQVATALPEKRDVQEFYTFTGNTAGVEEVDIRARVEGTLTGINFKDGQMVKKGDLLFTIESNSYLASQAAAEAVVQARQADLERATLDYERMEKAIQVNAVSKQELTTSKALRDQSKANLLAAQAELDKAKLNVDYTRVVSPIDGRVSRRLVDVGNLVGAGEKTLLANVIKLQPIYVYFNIGEDVFNAYFVQHMPMANESAPQAMQVGLSGGSDYAFSGVLDYIDNKVEKGMGKITLRGQIANEDGRLLPGMFVRVRIPAGIKKDALVIEEQAVMSDLAGKYVFVVDAGNIAQRRVIQLGQKLGDKVVVESGMEPNQRYILNNLHMVRSGAPVTLAQADASPAGPGGATGRPAAAANVAEKK